MSGLSDENKAMIADRIITIIKQEIKKREEIIRSADFKQPSIANVRAEPIINRNTSASVNKHIYAVDVSLSNGDFVLDLIHCMDGRLLFWCFSFERFFCLIVANNPVLGQILTDRATLGDRTAILQAVIDSLTDKLKKPRLGVFIEYVDRESVVSMVNVYQKMDMSRMTISRFVQASIRKKQSKTFVYAQYAALRICAPTAQAAVVANRDLPEESRVDFRDLEAWFHRETETRLIQCLEENGMRDFFGLHPVRTDFMKPRRRG